METRAPTIGRIAVAIGFALSCFGLLLFLWLSFGGPVPLSAKSYRFNVEFDEATQLALESDVRISGVSVGKVKEIELADSGLAEATVELEPEYAPIPSNTEAILRQKTLLGETYVELTPGDPDASEPLPEGGELAAAQVSEAVQLDEIFRTFDPETRAAFQTWMISAAEALNGRGADLNAAIGNLPGFAARGDDLLRILDSQRLAVRQLVRDGGQTFDAISERPGELRSLIENTEEVFSTTAARDQEIREIFQALPTFLDESTLTLNRLEEFSLDTDPLVTQLRPSARELSGTLVQLQELSPVMERFFNGLLPVIDRSQSGFGSLRTVLNDQLPPALGRVDRYFDEVIPILTTAHRYRRELTAFFANTAAATNGEGLPSGGSLPVKYLRATAPLGPGVLASPPEPYTTTRVNPYLAPGGYTKLAQGLDSLYTAQCAGGATAAITGPGDFPGDLYERTKLFALGSESADNTADAPAPPCRQQAPQRSIGGPPRESTLYPHVRPER